MAGTIQPGARCPRPGAGGQRRQVLQQRVQQPATPGTGGVLYVDVADGALKFKGSSGTVTTIAAA